MLFLTFRYLESKQSTAQTKKVIQEVDNFKKKNPSPKDMMKDVLSEVKKSMSAEDWFSIPEIGDYKYRRARRPEKFTPVPDNIIADSLDKQKLLGSVQPGTISKTGGAVSKLNSLGHMRDRVLQINLDRTGKSVINQSVVDRSGYITALQQMPLNGEIDIHDLQKARLLVQSMIKSDPNSPQGWVAAARIEEMDGQLSRAKSLLAQAVEHCPKSEDVWYEASRLENLQRKKEILAKAIKHVPKSLKLWLAAADAETEDKSRMKKVVNKALKFLPNSEKLWRRLINLAENDEQAKEALSFAVKFLPENLEMRLALAKLHPYEEAKEIIREANQYFKEKERSIWINACKLEEAQGKGEQCEKIIKRALKRISKSKVVIKREDWLMDAELCEQGGSPFSCKAIIKRIMLLDTKERDYIAQWIEDADLAQRRGHLLTVRTIYRYGMELEPSNADLYTKALDFERIHGTEKQYMEVLDIAIKNNESSPDYWLKLAQVYLQKKDPNQARKTLSSAIEINPKMSNLRIALSELEKQLDDPERSREVLKKARTEVNSSQIWRKSVLLELQQGQLQQALALAIQASKLFVSNSDVLCDLGWVFEELGQLEKARSVYGSMIKLKEHKTCERAWIQLVKLVSRLSGYGKARSIFEFAREVMGGSLPEILLLKAIMLEMDAGNPVIASNLILKGIQKYPKSGKLWAMAIETEPLSKRKAKSMAALDKCENSVEIVNAIARIFFIQKMPEKTSSWIERSLLIDPKNGDTWAFYLHYSRKLGKEDLEQEVLKRCKEAEPDHGEYWQRHSSKPVHWRMSSKQLLELTLTDLRKQLENL